MAPQVGFEPTTLRLTAECSTIELLRSIAPIFSVYTDSPRLKMGFPALPIRPKKPKALADEDGGLWGTSRILFKVGRNLATLLA